MAASLAKSIISAPGNDEIECELGGHQLDEFVNLAFKEPIQATEPFRITFVVGGGKKVRGKYSPDLPLLFAASLKNIGYAEDKGASVCEDCMGSYKYQHDTGKDLKYIHVFPKCTIIKQEENTEELAGFQKDKIPPEMIAGMAETDSFPGLVTAKCQSFTQRRCLLKAMKELGTKIEALDQKMVNMEKLDDKEQELYDTVVELPEKIKILTSNIQEMMDKNRLTGAEIQIMDSDLSEKMTKLDELIASSDEKKAAKLQSNKEVLNKQLSSLKKMEPFFHARRHDKEIVELQKRIQKMKADMAPLRNIEDKEAECYALILEGRGWYWDQKPKEDRQPKKPAAKKGGKK